MQTRTLAVTTASIGVAALTITGITYASANGSAESAQQSVAASGTFGGDDGEKKGGEDKDYGKKDDYNKDYDKGDYGKGHGKGHGKDDKDHDKGKIIVNGTHYPAQKYQCVPITSFQNHGDVAAKTFNVENLSKKIVEVFDTVNCSEAPEAILPPKSSQFVVKANVEDDVIVGSFKVIDSHGNKGDDHDDYDDYDY